MRSKTHIPRLLSAALLLCMLSSLPVAAFAGTVTETEAVALAEYWLQREIDGPYSRLNEAEKSEWRLRLDHPRVHYVLSHDVMADECAKSAKVLAYVVFYDEGGFAVISGDDRLEPIPAFDAYSRFRKDNVPGNFLRKYLAHNIPARWAYLKTRLSKGPVDTHVEWAQLKRSMQAPYDPEFEPLKDARDAEIYILLDTALWSQLQYYNHTVRSYNGGLNCPTGCTATAMAINMRFHCWPPYGTSIHEYWDLSDEVNYPHSVNFAEASYVWSSMPTEPLTATNENVSRLMYHCGVSVDMNYEEYDEESGEGGSGAWPKSEAFNNYFRYKGTETVDTDNAAAHVTGMRDSILAGLPVVVSTTVHTVLACGYRETQLNDRFYLNAGWDGVSNGWYDLDAIPGDEDPTIDLSLPYCAPNNYFFVDGSWTDLENGNLQNPYNTISEGYAATPSGGRLLIKGEAYNTAFTFSKPMTVVSYRGTATIGGS